MALVMPLLASVSSSVTLQQYIGHVNTELLGGQRYLLSNVGAINPSLVDTSGLLAALDRVEPLLQLPTASSEDRLLVRVGQAALALRQAVKLMQWNKVGQILDESSGSVNNSTGTASKARLRLLEQHPGLRDELSRLRIEVANNETIGSLRRALSAGRLISVPQLSRLIARHQQKLLELSSLGQSVTNPEQRMNDSEQERT